jgi:alpha-L-arabinofuranosidase
MIMNTATISHTGIQPQDISWFNCRTLSPPGTGNSYFWRTTAKPDVDFEAALCHHCVMSAAKHPFSFACCLIAGLSLPLTFVVAQDAGTPGKRLSATIDATKTSAPVSPYLYGQFIEHIADTVNRSVWDEMLDDRKFYYPIDSKTPAPAASRGRQPNPWRPIGPDESVVMDAEHAYTGEHSPLIKLDGTEPRGIVQAGVVLKKGRAYSGRAVLAGDAGANVSVSLIWGSGPNERQTVPIKDLKSDYAKFPLSFTAGADAANGRIEIAGTGKSAFHIGAVSLMPADNDHGFRPDTIALLKAQRSGMYRWPGGNFLSAHEWRDAIGDIDRRPPKWDPVWNALQPNDVGTDEFFYMTELLGVESFLSVNAGFGDAHSAAELVEYVTGSTDTPMGKLRAANGHPAPYKVKWWGIGNEMWGDFQFGYMALKQYVFKHNLFGEAMRKVDPTIKLVGDGNTPRMADILTERDWSGTMLTKCLKYIDVMSEHFYTYEGGQQSNAAQKKAPPPVDDSIIDTIHRVPNSVRSKIEVYEEYYQRIPELKTNKVPVAIDEWAYSRLPANMKQTLGNALCFHEMFRHTDVLQMAGHTMATSVLDFNPNEAALNATGLLFKLYRDHMGTIPVAVDGNSPTLPPVRSAGGGAARPNAGSPTWPLDVSAALSADGKRLTIAIINPTESAQELDVTIQGVQISGKGRMWGLSGPNLTAMAGLTHHEVQLTEAPVTEAPKTLHVPKLSIEIYEFEKAP